MNFRQRPREPLELNLIPLIDVVFMLLIFFMLTTTFVHDRTLKVDLPVSESGSSERAELKNHVIELDARGEIAIDGTRVSEQDLPRVLAEIANDGRPVVLWADANVVNQRVVTVLDQARRAGVEKIGMGTTPPR
ncbi:biopolymer transporter ExbD [Guyparkeria sp. SCN-R1]|uniref:ExbD/TolR family protein n=1 Tax=unclassified Guyparkeria TaxID=2626246 RepID=UPI000F64A7F2|nr:biopolymer transporter ExbD [Guyparkeria sp. SCN-R1]RRQ23331.1 biopolymer transporter ExbD [Guyparkeria sp. SCN-R1]